MKTVSFCAILGVVVLAWARITFAVEYELLDDFSAPNPEVWQLADAEVTAGKLLFNGGSTMEYAHLLMPIPNRTDARFRWFGALQAGSTYDHTIDLWADENRTNRVLTIIIYGKPSATVGWFTGGAITFTTNIPLTGTTIYDAELVWTGSTVDLYMRIPTIAGYEDFVLVCSAPWYCTESEFYCTWRGRQNYGWIDTLQYYSGIPSPLTDATLTDVYTVITTSNALLKQNAALAAQAHDLLCMLLAFAVFQTFERAASKRGFM